MLDHSMVSICLDYRQLEHHEQQQRLLASAVPITPTHRHDTHTGSGYICCISIFMSMLTLDNCSPSQLIGHGVQSYCPFGCLTNAVTFVLERAQMALSALGMASIV